MSRFNSHFRPFAPLQAAPPLHFWLLQFFGFAECAYRFSSRNYSVYGLLPADAFEYHRALYTELLPIPLLHFTTLQFIYEWIPRPGPGAIEALQIIVVMACACGILGILPKLASLTALLVGSHIVGFVQASNADLDGAVLTMCVLLALSLSPRASFYGPFARVSLGDRSTAWQWPVFVCLLLVGSFYSFSGVSKLVDVGPHWPVALHVERLAAVGIEDSLFVGSRYRDPAVASYHLSGTLSAITGTASLAAEIGFLSILWIPRYRFLLVLSMVSMHIAMYALQGLNFLASIPILLLCFDWNVLVRKATIVYDDNCNFCQRAVARMKKLDWFGRLTFQGSASFQELPPGVDAQRLQVAMALVDENGEVYYGADAFEQAAARCPAGWPFALLMKLPFAIYIARRVYSRVAGNRNRFGCTPDNVCDLH